MPKSRLRCLIILFSEQKNIGRVYGKDSMEEGLVNNFDRECGREESGAAEWEPEPEPINTTLTCQTGSGHWPNSVPCFRETLTSTMYIPWKTT
jgi:hypothetical protein